MTHGTFLWADLSTFRPEITHDFYTRLMGWQIAPDDYAIASRNARPVAGIYPMPEKFVAMGMPSFWMSYIAVADIAGVVEKARALGGKVEVGPSPFEGGGAFALIRDPLGAGFTVYEGRALDGAQAGPGGRRGHGLFVSEADAVMAFYRTLFGWDFSPPEKGIRQIRQGGRSIAHLHEIPDPTLRGKEQYWAVLFDAPPEAAARVAEAGGEVLAETDLPEGPALLARDPDGAAFFLCAGRDGPDTQTAAPRHWRASAGLGLIGLALVTGWGWISALFCAIWIGIGLRDRETYLFEPVTRAKAPLLYWLILGSFAALGTLALAGY